MSNENYLAVFNNSSAALYINSMHDGGELMANISLSNFIQSVNAAFAMQQTAFDPAAKVKCLAPLGELLAPLYNSAKCFGKDSGILPPGVLYFDNNYVIFERPPMYQNVSMIPRMMDDIDYRRNEISTYRLPIPWQVYVVNFVNNPDENGNAQYYAANVRMLFTDGPIQSFDDRVYLPPLPNFYTNGDLCRPMYNSIDDIERFSKDVAGVIESAFEWIWNSGTNLDLTNAIVQYYYQFQNSMADRTVFQDIKDIQIAESFAGTLFFHNYYCNFSLVEHLMRSWEKLDLDGVMGLRWPNQSVTRSMQHEIDDLYGDLLMEYAREKGFVTEDDMHYDEDADNWYQCGENGCSCMGGEDINFPEFLRWAEVGPHRVSTFRMSLSEFSHQCITPHDQAMIRGRYGHAMLDRAIQRVHVAWSADS